MDSYEPADDDKYTIGIAAFVCLMSLPILYLLSQPFILTVNPPWTSWFLASLYALAPPLTSFVILYRGPWKLDWFPLKRAALSLLLSCVIYCIELVFLFCFAIAGFLWSNCSFISG
jgi:hypothetical protein